MRRGCRLLRGRTETGEHTHQRGGITGEAKCVADLLRRGEPGDTGHADDRRDPTEKVQRLAEGDRRHDRHEDHLGLHVDRSDCEIAHLERTEQGDRAEDLGGPGPGDDRPERHGIGGIASPAATNVTRDATTARGNP